MAHAVRFEVSTTSVRFTVYINIMQVNLFTGIAKLLMAAALLFFLIALGSSYWQSGTGFHSGLWEVCAGGKCARIDAECKYTLFTPDKVNDCDALNAVRAFTFLAMLFAAVTLLLAIVWAFKQSEGLKIPTAALAGVAGMVLLQSQSRNISSSRSHCRCLCYFIGVCGLISMAIYVGKSSANRVHAHLSCFQNVERHTQANR